VDNQRLQGPTTANIWEGEFPTWQLARLAAASIGGEGLVGDKWFQRITQQLTDYRDEFRVHGIAMPPRPCNLAAVCALTAPSSIVDFGGSSGWCWDYLQNTLINHTVSSYTVVETDEVVEYMKCADLHQDPVMYKTAREPLGIVDLLYCNSVLQYFESNEPFLSLVECSLPKFILLEDLVAKGEKDFFTIQLFRGSAIPYRFLGLELLLRALADIGYVELARYPYASPVNGVIAPIAMSNFPQAMQLRYSSSVLLKQSVEI